MTPSFKRQPVFRGKSGRVPNLWQRQLADGRLVFEFAGHLGGKTTRKRLEAQTKSDALAELRALLAARDRGDILLPRGGPRLAEVVEEYLRHARSRLAPRTVELYEQRLNAYLLPALGARRIASVQAADLRRWLDGLRAHKPALAASTQTGILVAASAMFRYAAKQGLIERSPARDLDRDDRPGGKRQTEPRYLDAAQIEALLAKLSDEFRPIGAALAFGGLRVSEALGLRWRDLDLAAGRLTVSQQFAPDGSLAPLKTEASAATIDLLPALGRALKAHRARQAERGIHLLAPDGLVFTTRTGRPQSRRNTLRAVNVAAENAGLGHVRPHDLRHSFVSCALAAGLSLAEASRLARHASPRVTAAVYADVLESQREALAAKLSAAGFGS